MSISPIVTTRNIKARFRDTARRLFKREHYKYQLLIVYAILDALIESQSGKTSEIPIQLPRQSGKTTSIVDVVSFLLSVGVKIFGRPLSIGIFAPQKEQATTDFDRLKMQFTSDLRKLGFRTEVSIKKDDIKFPTKWNSQTIRIFSRSGKYLGEVFIFPISKTSKIESKSLDLAIIEEAQDVNDEVMKKSVFPMLASTNGPRIYVGTSGTRICYFKRELENNPKRIVISLDEVFKQREEAFKTTGNEMHLRYHRYVAKEIEKNGEDSDYIQTQYKGKWIIGSGQFTTAEELDALIGKFKTEDSGKDADFYVGIDTAKHVDRTVVTVIKKHRSWQKARLVSWLSLKGMNYEDQFDTIKKYLSKFEGIKAVAIDATGQGDFMPDKFERNTAYNIVRVKFGSETKDGLYKALLQVIKNQLTEIPDVPMDSNYLLFRQEMLDLEKEYNGVFLSCHHPDGPGMHDDFPDSWALAEHARFESEKNQPTLRFV